MATRPSYWYLQQIDLFDGLKEEDLMAITEFSIEHFFSKKELLFQPGEKLDTIYILKEGEVTIYQMHQGKKVILDILKPGSFFGNISLSPHEQTTYFAEASDKVMICALSTKTFLAIVQQYPEIVLRLLQKVTDKMHEYEQRIKTTALYSGKWKVLEAIKMIKRKDTDSFLPEILRKKTKITHEKIASLTGLARETVTKAIAELESEGKILINGRKIELAREKKKGK